jgi:hypothetical protein
MALVTRKVANPIKSAVVITRHGGKNMATQKKKKSSSSSKKRSSAAKTTRRKTQSRNPVNPVNPVRASSKKRGGKKTTRPRRNPLMSGATGEVLSFAGAGLGLGIAQPLLANAVGRFLPFGVYNAPILTFGTGWLLSALFKMIPFTRPLARPTFILGASTAVIQVTQPFVRGLIGNGGAGPVPTMGRYRNGMSGIGIVTGYPPHVIPPPPPPPPNGVRNGMGGVGVVPGRFGR